MKTWKRRLPTMGSSKFFPILLFFLLIVSCANKNIPYNKNYVRLTFSFPQSVKAEITTLYRATSDSKLCKTLSTRDGKLHPNEKQIMTTITESGQQLVPLYLKTMINCAWKPERIKIRFLTKNDNHSITALAIYPKLPNKNRELFTKVNNPITITAAKVYKISPDRFFFKVFPNDSTTSVPDPYYHLEGFTGDTIPVAINLLMDENQEPIFVE